MRGRGIAFDVAMPLYEGATGEIPTRDEVLSFAADMADPADPDRNFPVFASSLVQLENVFQYDGMHPGHCLLDPDRVIRWCVHGHGLEDVVRDTIIAFAE